MWVSLVFLGLLGLGLGVRNKIHSDKAAELEIEKQEALDAAKRKPTVQVANPIAVTYRPYVLVSGTLEPTESAELGFSLGGRLLKISAKLGEEVKSGALLASLDRKTIGAQASQAEAGMGVAQSNVNLITDRVELLSTLVQSGAAAERDLKNAKEQLALAQAQLRQASAGRSVALSASGDHLLRAPFSGTVTRAPSSLGVVVGPGMPLYRIENTKQYVIRTTVSQEEIAQISEGDEVVLFSTETTREGTPTHRSLGTLVRKANSLDPMTKRAPIEIMFERSALHPSWVTNSLVRVRVYSKSEISGYRLPQTSRSTDGKFLVVNQDGLVEERALAAVGDADGSWLVTDGLAPHDQIVFRASDAEAGSMVTPKLEQPTR